MRRQFWGGILVALALVSGCQSQPADSTAAGGSADAGKSDTAAEPGSKGTIGYTTMSLTNPFFKVIGDAMTAEAREHGYDVVVVSGDDDVSKQANQIDDFIVKGVKAIVITPCDPRSIGAAIRKANEKGIPVFTNDTGYDGEDAEVVCHVATDNFLGGQLAGQAMVALLGESGGKIMVIHKSDAQSCQLRVAGFTEVIDAHNAKDGAAQIEIVTTQEGKGAREAGYEVTKDAIVAHPDLVALFAINDPSALGARAALEEAGKQDQVTIIGFDGELAGKQAIRDGKILCDPIQFPDQMGRTTVQQIVAFFDGEDVPAEILIEPRLYYKKDADQDAALQDTAN